LQVNRSLGRAEHHLSEGLLACIVGK
jgi:hypothetical protein